MRILSDQRSYVGRPPHVHGGGRETLSLTAVVDFGMNEDREHLTRLPGGTHRGPRIIPCALPTRPAPGPRPIQDTLRSGVGPRAGPDRPPGRPPRMPAGAGE